MQGALFYPAGYEAGKQVPDGRLHVREAVGRRPRLLDAVRARLLQRGRRSPRSGYVLFQPDIVFRPREPGLSVVDCVVPAVQRVIEMGIADPARVGIIGHSWGGFDTVVLATHTDIFAAGVAGAPITDLVSNYGNHHWSSGIAETDHIETGQQRMQVPLYEDLQAYIRNSAIYKAHTMKTPLLVEVGDNDGTVHWHQGVELYNIARRAGKNVVMLQYGGEDHGLRKRANQIDYHHRIMEWFDHYLTRRRRGAVDHLRRALSRSRARSAAAQDAGQTGDHDDHGGAAGVSCWRGRRGPAPAAPSPPAERLTARPPAPVPMAS